MYSVKHNPVMKYTNPLNAALLPSGRRWHLAWSRTTNLLH